jgi:hypothetical protein
MFAIVNQSFMTAFTSTWSESHVFLSNSTLNRFIYTAVYEVSIMRLELKFLFSARLVLQVIESSQNHDFDLTCEMDFSIYTHFDAFFKLLKTF